VPAVLKVPLSTVAQDLRQASCQQIEARLPVED
jgi:hypothetical protein